MTDKPIPYIQEMTDDAYVFGVSFFPSRNSTLLFGGDHATMEITPRGRAALTELVRNGFVEPCEPLDGWPGREQYRSLLGVRIPTDRKHLNPFALERDDFKWTIFQKKEPTNDR